MTELHRAAIVPPAKSRKTLTYSQQLQQLQPPKDTYRGGTSESTLASIAFDCVNIVATRFRDISTTFFRCYLFKYICLRNNSEGPTV